MSSTVPKNVLLLVNSNPFAFKSCRDIPICLKRIIALPKSPEFIRVRTRTTSSNCTPADLFAEAKSPATRIQRSTSILLEASISPA